MIETMPIRDPEARKAYHKEYAKQHYQDNKEKYKESARRNRPKQVAARKQFLLDYLASHPCVDCGEDDIVVLEFDHARGEKSFSIASSTGRPFKQIKAELLKCDVVCANCHTRRTAKRAGWPKFLAQMAQSAEASGSNPDS